ncbi:S-type pyocin domain-containing protein [Vibrio sp. 10N.222.54.F12]|uniref:S-type pyocin domain-containing protein n=1 Tax=Vibrio TaxID=662 RepID=UPI0018E45565|nr:S-type pyocin domain-containing protein [Vibrio tasmaniensis]
MTTKNSIFPPNSMAHDSPNRTQPLGIEDARYQEATKDSFFPKWSIAYDAEARSSKGVTPAITDAAVTRQNAIAAETEAANPQTANTNSLASSDATSNVMKTVSELFSSSSKKCFASSIMPDVDKTQSIPLREYGEVAVLTSGKSTDFKKRFSKMTPEQELKILSGTSLVDMALSDLGAWRITHNDDEVLPAWCLLFCASGMKAEHLINREEFNQLSNVNTELKLRLQTDESGKEDLIAFHRDGEKLPVIQAEPNPESGSKAFKATLPSGVVIEWNGVSKQGPLFHNGAERRFGSLRQEKVLPIDGKTQDIEGVSDDAVEEVIIAFPKQKFLEPLYLVLPKFKEESKVTINPKNMYWPPYNPLAKDGEKEINIEYTQDVVKFAVLEPAEWTVFFDTFDKSKTVKDTVTGLYNARETAKALGGVGVTALVKTIDGVDYVVLKNYDKWSQSLLHGGVFKADNARVIKLGLGALDSVKGMARFVKVSAPMEILVGSGINVLQFIVNDEYTLKKLGVDQAKIFVNILAVSGLAIGAVYFFPILGATALYSGVTLVISSTVVWTVDKLTDFESKFIEKVLGLSE